jgi:hypothetical protein
MTNHSTWQFPINNVKAMSACDIVYQRNTYPLVKTALLWLTYNRANRIVESGKKQSTSLKKQGGSDCFPSSQVVAKVETMRRELNICCFTPHIQEKVNE